MEAAVCVSDHRAVSRTFPYMNSSRSSHALSHEYDISADASNISSGIRYDDHITLVLLEIRDSIDGWGYKLDTWIDYCRR
jgi:hypothetical protein